MKTKKLIILFLLLSPMVALFTSCPSCDVTTSNRIKYSHKTLILKNLDNSGEQAIESEVLELNKNSYGIRLYLTRERNTIACARQSYSLFFHSAYAFTPARCLPAYIFSPTDSIISIKVFTLNNFDNQHPENSDITNYFKVAQSYSVVKEHIANMPFTYEYDFEAQFEKKLKIDLMLMTAPTRNNPHQFNIQVTLSDKRIFEQETTEIELL